MSLSTERARRASLGCQGEIEAAKTRARQHAQEFYLGEPEPEEDWFVFLSGEVAVRCTSVEETTPERLATRLAL